MQGLKKDIVSRRFERCIPLYNENAVVQREMADALIKHLIEMVGTVFDNALEIGCGSGILTKHIVRELKFKRLIANDIVKGYSNIITSIDKRITFLYGDIEKIDIKATFDLIISNATFQWLNLTNTIQKTKKLLKTDGIIAFTTFGKNNLREIKELTGRGLHYYDLDYIHSLLNDFDILFSMEMEKILFFDRAIDILYHLRNTGTNAFTGGLWTMGRVKEFTTKYKRFRQNSGFPLTYNPIYVIARYTG